MVALAAVAGNHLADESGKEQHNADDEGNKSKVEERLVGYRPEAETIGLIYKLFDDEPDCYDATDEECYKTSEAKEMHRLLAEFAQEPKRKQVKEAIDKTLDTEFAFAVFPFLMMNRFFRNLVEAGILCQIRNVPVHLTIYFNVFYDLFPVGFQTAVHIVQLDAGNPSCSRVIEF